MPKFNLKNNRQSYSATIQQFLNGLDKFGVESLPPKWSRLFAQLIQFDRNRRQAIKVTPPTPSPPSPIGNQKLPFPSISTEDWMPSQTGCDFKGPMDKDKSNHPTIAAERKASFEVSDSGEISAEALREMGIRPFQKVGKEAPQKSNQTENSSQFQSTSGWEGTISNESVDKRPYVESLAGNSRIQVLHEMQHQISGCQQCPQLVSCRSKTVLGEGNVTPRLLFLGDAPGADDDRHGRPFLGAAGQLLEKIIAACSLQRSDVYLMNAIKCRPPGNRNPLPEELANCWNFTQRQFEILQPEFICCLGVVATRQLLQTTEPLGKLRKRFHKYRGSQVLVTYHPAYLLRTESVKKYVWEDMQMLMKEMGINLSN